MATTWDIDYAAIARLVDHPSVQREADDRADRAVAACTAACPKGVRYPVEGDEGEEEERAHLVDTIRKDTVGSGRRVSYGGPEAPYAAWVEWDTLPHRIVAAPGRWLRWEDDEGVHYAKAVDHPGTKGQHIMGGVGVDAAGGTGR